MAGGCSSTIIVAVIVDRNCRKRAVEKSDRENIERMASLAPPDGRMEIRCGAHPDSVADFICAECGTGICLRCVADSGFGNPLLCRACASRRKWSDGEIKRHVLDFTNIPLLWVIFCMLSASIAFAAGFGRTDLSRYSKEHAVLPWFAWRDANLLLGKASRQRRRASYLHAEGKTEEARRWSKSSSEYFAAAAEAWKEQDVHPDLLFASATALSESSGDPEPLLALSKTLDVKSESRLSPFIRFQTCRITGDEAGMRSAGASIYSSRTSSVDMIIEMAENLREKTAAEKIRIVCGSSQMAPEYAKFADMSSARTETKCAESAEDTDKKGTEPPSGDFEVEIVD